MAVSGAGQDTGHYWVLSVLISGLFQGWWISLLVLEGLGPQVHIPGYRDSEPGRPWAP